MNTVHQVNSQPNVNLFGFLNDIESISRHTTSFIDCLPNDIPIQLFQTKNGSFKDLKESHKNILSSSVNLRDRKSLLKVIQEERALTGITIYTDSQWYDNAWDAYKSIMNNCALKFAYCVTERTKIQESLVAKFNDNFDAIIVPDEWLIDICKKSGVKIPIFSLPLAINLHSLLSKTVKRPAQNSFTFGFSGGFWPRKNHELLINAFYQEFKNNPRFNLILHGRFEDDPKSAQNVFRFVRSKKNIK